MKNSSFPQSPFVLLNGIMILGFAAFSPMLGAGFKTMDDYYSIVENPDIKAVSNIGKILSGSFFGGDDYYRPLVSLSFMLEYQVFGLNPFFFNLDNLLLHLLSSIAVFWIVDLLMRSRRTAFFAALLFALHPIQWEAVSNIAGRSIVLCAFFYFYSFLFFISYLLKKKGPGCLVFSGISFALALLCKESAVVLPLVMAAFLLIVKPPTPLARSIALLAPYFLILAAYFFLRQHLGFIPAGRWGSFAEMGLGIAAFVRSVMTDLRLIVFPVGLHFDRAQDLFAFGSAPFCLVVAFLFICGLGVFYFRKSITGINGFWIVWFIFGLLPVSQIVPVLVQSGQIAAADHFLYIPCVGIFAILGVGLDALIQRRVAGISPKTAAWAAGGFFGFLFMMNFSQNIFAAQEIAMFKDSLEINPSNARIRNSLGLAYAKRGLFKEAEEEFRQVLALEPGNTRGRISLAKSLCDQGKVFDGILEYEKIPSAGGLQELLETNKKLSYGLLIGQYQKRIQQEPENPGLYFSLGVMYSRVGRTSEAIEAYQKSFGLNRDNPNVVFNLASLYEALGEWDLARENYLKLLEFSAAEPALIEHAQIHLQLIDEKLKSGAL